MPRDIHPLGNWLQRFFKESPLLFNFLAFAFAIALAGLVLMVADFLDWLARGLR